MNVNQLVDDLARHRHVRSAQVGAEAQPANNPFQAWQNIPQMEPYASGEEYFGRIMPDVSATSRHSHTRTGSYSAHHGLPPKQVTFEYLLTEGTQQRARLPMRVNIYPHDGTDSIITTVKNFYGLYDGNGVSFEDKDGCTLIARYENFEDKMVVHVRVVDNVGGSGATTPMNSLSPRRPRLGPPFQMAAPDNHGPSISRPSSRTARNRSASPSNLPGRRSQSASTTSKSRIRSIAKSRNGSTQGSVIDTHGDNDVSDSDGGNASVTSSRRGKIDVVVSADISVENIVEGGRRKRARFDSSELPLFVPSQVPMQTSISSVSPQRRVGSQPAAASPYQYPPQHTFTWNNALPSPQSHNNSEHSYLNNAFSGYSGQNGANCVNNAQRQRGAVQYGPARPLYQGVNNGILPTPDPTIGGSTISDDEVARQLMALGDPSNFSNHGRTSTSTLDDAFSGKAELASSVDESMEGSEIDDHDMLPEGAVSSEYSSGEDYEDTSFKGESDGILPEDRQAHEFKVAKTRIDGTAPQKARSESSQKTAKPSKPRTLSMAKAKSKALPGFNVPISPTSLPPHSRKASNASLQLFGAEEDDLSTKPRCQRCRKSKKGCDRQRPCGRCKDAGIGIEGCVSEDEGNGRKGRYGRLMGVSVKTGLPELLPPSPTSAAQPIIGSMAAPNFVPDKTGKKRKR